MSPPVSSLKLFKSLLLVTQCHQRALKLAQSRCHMSCKKSWPSNPCKPTDCKSSSPGEQGSTPRPAKPCTAQDPLRPPNLCTSNSSQSGDSWRASPSCNSSDPRQQTIPCGSHKQSRDSCAQKRSASEGSQSSYPHKPWTMSRPTTWTPSNFIVRPCGSDSCKPPDQTR